MKELKRYQEIALDKLINRTKEFFKEEGNERCTWLQFLDSPQIRHPKQALSDSATAKKC